MGETFSILVVGPEGPGRELLLDQLSSLAEVVALQEVAELADALDPLWADHVDVIFVDAAATQLDGRGWEQLSGRPSGAPQVVPYLVPPIRPQQLRQLLQLLASPAADPGASGREQKQIPTPDPGPGWAALRNRVPVVCRGQLRLVTIEAVHMATFDDRRVVVRTQDGAFYSTLSMAEFEARVRGRAFLRVHRRYIVNLDHVQSVQSQINGTCVLRVGSGTSEYPVPVSRRRAVELREELRL